MPLSPSDDIEIGKPGVAKEDSPASTDVEDSSPQPTHEEVLKQQLESSEEKQADGVQEDSEIDPETGDQTDPEKVDSDKSDEEEAKKTEDDAPLEEEDPANIPEEEFKALSERSQKRFQKIVNERNTATERISELAEYQRSVHETIKASNSTPEQMADMLEFTRLENSSNRDDNQAALNLAVEKVKALSQKLGVKVPGTNVLEGHQDLIDRVELGEIDLSDAEELALARNKRSHDEKIAQVKSEETQKADSNAQMLKSIADGITAQFKTWQANDPQWPQKEAIIAAKGKEIKANYQPIQYLQVIKDFKALLDQQFREAEPKPDPEERLPGGSSPSREREIKPSSHEEALRLVLDGKV